MNIDEIIHSADKAFEAGDYGKAYTLYRKIGKLDRPERFRECAEYLNFYINDMDNPWGEYETVRCYCRGDYLAAAQRNNIEAILKIMEEKISRYSHCMVFERDGIEEEIKRKYMEAKEAKKLFDKNIDNCVDAPEYKMKYRKRMEESMQAIDQIFDDFIRENNLVFVDGVRRIENKTDKLICDANEIKTAINDLKIAISGKLNEIESKMNSIDSNSLLELGENLKTIIEEYNNNSGTLTESIKKIIEDASNNLQSSFDKKYAAINEIVNNDDADNIFVDFRNVTEQLEYLIKNKWEATEDKVGKSLTSVKSAMILMKMLSQNDLGDDVNYNFLSISSTAAIELKLKEIFFYNYKAWCRNRFKDNYSDWPSELIHRSHNRCEESTNFTIGSLRYYTMNTDKDGQPKNDRERLTQYVKDVYGKTIVEVKEIVDQLENRTIKMFYPDMEIDDGLYSIADMRNQTAHSRIALIDAIKCCRKLLGFGSFENNAFQFEKKCLMKKLLKWNIETNWVSILASYDENL